jgi:hypothetical protein
METSTMSDNFLNDPQPTPLRSFDERIYDNRVIDPKRPTKRILSSVEYAITPQVRDPLTHGWPSSPTRI